MKITASAPGKLILAGEHSVVYGEPALATALDLRTTVVIDTSCVPKNVTTTDEKQVVVDLHSFDTFGIIIRYYGNEYHAEQLRKEDGHSSQVQGSVKSIVLALNKLKLSRQINCKISISSTIPCGCGLGSSGAFSIALSAALMQLTGNYTQSVGDFANSLERVFHDNPSGIDTHISQHGGLVKFQKNAEPPDSPTKSPKAKIAKSSSATKFTITQIQMEKSLLEGGFSVQIVNTNVTRSTKSMVNRVRKNWKENRDFVEGCCKAITALVLELQDKLQGGDIERAEETLVKNHHLLNAIGVGHSSLDTAHSLAKNKYDVVLKTTGAGGGGCMFALRELPVDLVEELTSQHFTTFKSKIMAPGLTVEIS